MEKDGEKVKVICLGDSAVGKSKYRFIYFTQINLAYKLGLISNS